MTSKYIIAWDFDGVLNRNIVGGKFIWQRNFEKDLGLPLKSFEAFMFQGNFKKAMTGDADLIELSRECLSQHNTDFSPTDLLAYWFAKDALPDVKTLEILQQCRDRGFGNIIATNNEVHRSNYIESEMGFGSQVDQIFAAGRLGLAKPDLRFFSRIAEALETEPSRLIPVDDLSANVEAALRAGWGAIHFVQNGHRELEMALSNFNV